MVNNRKLLFYLKVCRRATEPFPTLFSENMIPSIMYYYSRGGGPGGAGGGHELSATNGRASEINDCHLLVHMHESAAPVQMRMGANTPRAPSLAELRAA